jgi:hypothetical protein
MTPTPPAEAAQRPFDGTNPARSLRGPRADERRHILDLIAKDWPLTAILERLAAWLAADRSPALAAVATLPSFDGYCRLVGPGISPAARACLEAHLLTTATWDGRPCRIDLAAHSGATWTLLRTAGIRGLTVEPIRAGDGTLWAALMLLSPGEPSPGGEGRDILADAVAVARFALERQAESRQRDMVDRPAPFGVPRPLPKR